MLRIFPVILILTAVFIFAAPGDAAEAASAEAAAASSSKPAGSSEENRKFLPAADGRLVIFNRSYPLDTIRQNNSKAVLSADGQALEITTLANTPWPGINLNAPSGHWDLSQYEYIALDFHNIDNHDFDVFVRVDNPGADGSKNCFTERVGTQPDQRTTITIPIKRSAQTKIKLFNMHGRPDGLYENGGIDPADIVALTIFTAGQDVDSTVRVSNIRAFGKYQTPKWLNMSEKEFFPFIDQFGQFIHKDWPGKIKSDADLIRNRDAEAAALAAAAAPNKWNEYGGYAAGPQLEATGHFRVEKYQGKWWLIDPSGHLFFSTGLCCVTSAYGTTALANRPNWFQGLPDSGAPLGQYRQKSWDGTPNFNFSESNLHRKYGDNWRKTYPELVSRRLRAWGINTVANWSAGDYYLGRKTPYAATCWYGSKRLKDGKANFPDMYDPEFTQQVENVVGNILKATNNDPWCIGYFIDNEMSWGGSATLAEYALSSGAAQKAKQALRTALEKKYGTAEKFCAAWGINVLTWDAFLQRTDLRPATPAGTKDLEDFTGEMADVYFKTVRSIIKKHAPQKLYLGCRCVGGAPSIVAAAAKYCDVFSYNAYCASVRDLRVPGGLDVPIIIGEFHFGGLDRGLFWGGLFSAADQNDRARKYQAYVESALDNPQIVGVHWFQYGDEPATGRYDGENAQCGFVDIADTPYPETIKAARAVADNMYDRRFPAGR